MNAQEHASPQEEGRAIMIFVFGILSIVALGPLLGIPAWIMGHADLAKIGQGRIPRSEYQMTKAGMIMGIIGTFYLFAVVFAILVLVLIPFLLFSLAH